jgi:flagellar protein FlbD
MIELTKLNNERYFMNPDLIEIIESNPDTLITMTNGKTHYARETPEEVIRKIEDFRINLMLRFQDKQKERQRENNDSES